MCLHKKVFQHKYDNISRVVIKHVFKVSTESNTNQTVQLVKVDS